MVSQRKLSAWNRTKKGWTARKRQRDDDARYLMEEEVARLKTLLSKTNEKMAKMEAEKDQEIDRLREARELVILQLQSRSPVPRQIQTFRVLTPMWATLRDLVLKSSVLPVFRRFVNFSNLVVDVGVKRTTSLDNCAELDRYVHGFLPFIDDFLIAPHVQAWQVSARAVCNVAITNVSRMSQPYMVMARPYLERARPFAMHALKAVEGLVRSAASAARPAVRSVCSSVQPLFEIVLEVLNELVERLDAQVGTVLDRVSPAEIYELASYYTCVVRDFLQAHAGDLRQVALACGRMAGNFTDLASRSASLAHQQDASCAQTTSRYGNAA
eukprot:TRINITY_DN19689_c0_g4_i1.p1 TRINITY_DN19689_c0_g4~~TRINITY_DN19689_c0_g4_i1.p1  ORF type:complete len:374 (-),score=49.29 TRINITY_DN19689_c0_g4_i1:208-1188(-)